MVILCIDTDTHTRTHTHTHTHTDVGNDKHFKIALIADQDTHSKIKSGSWGSWLKTGTLILHADRTLSVKWDKDMLRLTTRMAEKERGAELSDLCVFNGRLYTVGDRTGIGNVGTTSIILLFELH